MKRIPIAVAILSFNPYDKPLDVQLRNSSCVEFSSHPLSHLPSPFYINLEQIVKRQVYTTHF